MKIKLYIGTFMLLAMILSIPSHASVGYQDAEPLVKSLLPTVGDYLPFVEDETESAKLKEAILNHGNSVQIFNASRTNDKKSYVLIYGHVMPPGVDISSMLFVADDDDEFKKIAFGVPEDASVVMQTAGLKMVRLEQVKQSKNRSDYYRVVDADGKNIGNYIFVSRGKNFLTVKIFGPDVFEDAEKIDQFLSEKIEKALSFKPDENSPNFSP